jgi:hypothetical protein
MGWEDEGFFEGEDNPEELGEYEHNPEELVEYEDNPQETVELLRPDWMTDDCWKEITKIEDPEVRQDQMEREEKVMEERKELDRKVESGEIDDFGYWAGDLDLHFKEARVATRRGLRSVGLDYDKLGELSEKYDIMVKGDPEFIDINDRLNELVKEDPEAAQKIADRRREEGNLPEEAYDRVCEKVKRYK